MRIKWFGHSFFEITSDSGTRIITDPFDDSLGYDVPNIAGDVVTVSHEHYDHNAVDSVQGTPIIIKGAGRHEAAGLDFIGVSSFHDNVNGAKRGYNTIFVFKVDGIKMVHLGDLGMPLSLEKASEIGEVDILFAPIGGTYTVDSQGVDEIIELLKPRVTVPMHYKTPAIDLDIDGVDKFLKGKEKVEKAGYVWNTTIRDLVKYDRWIIVMDYSH